MWGASEEPHAFISARIFEVSQRKRLNSSRFRGFDEVSTPEICVFNYNSLEKSHEFEARSYC